MALSRVSEGESGPIALCNVTLSRVLGKSRIDHMLQGSVQLAPVRQTDLLECGEDAFGQVLPAD